MDRRERFEDLNVAVTAALRGLQAGIWTAMPGILQSFDASKRVAEVQVAIQSQILAPDGSTSNAAISVLTHCPVVFPRGGGYELTFPLLQGDEGLVVFASRCVDSWWSSGGVQPQAELRMHDLSDGFFIPGPYSQATKPAQAASTTAAQLRSADGLVRVELAAGHVVNLVAPGGINIVGPLRINGLLCSVSGSAITFEGDLAATGNVVAGQGTADQVGVQTHVHAGVQTGGGSTSAPTAGT